MLLAQAGSPYCRAGPHLSNRIYSGEMAEWSNALVLKTSEGHTSGGSNPSFSAKTLYTRCLQGFLFYLITNNIIFYQIKRVLLGVTYFYPPTDTELVPLQVLLPL